MSEWDRNSVMQHPTSAAETLKRQAAKIKGLELDLGLMRLARDQQAGLLNSCELALDKRNQRSTDLYNMLAKKLDLIRCGIGGNYSGDPKENDAYTEVVSLLDNA